MSVFDTLKKVTSLLDGHKEKPLKDSKLLEESREEQLKESLKDPKLVETLKGFLSPESKDMLSKFTAISQLYSSFQSSPYTLPTGVFHPFLVELKWKTSLLYFLSSASAA